MSAEAPPCREEQVSIYPYLFTAIFHLSAVSRVDREQSSELLGEGLRQQLSELLSCMLTFIT